MLFLLSEGMQQNVKAYNRMYLCKTSVEVFFFEGRGKRIIFEKAASHFMITTLYQLIFRKYIWYENLFFFFWGERWK